MAQQNVFGYVSFVRGLRPHLVPYADMMYLQLEVDLLDAIEIGLLPPNFFLAHPYVTSMSTTYEAMCSLPKCQVLFSRLRTLGVPQELREQIRCDWILQYAAVVSN